MKPELRAALAEKGRCDLPGVLLAAMAKAQLRFKGASERGWAMGTCEPVNTTGMGTLRSIKLIIEEV